MAENALAERRAAFEKSDCAGFQRQVGSILNHKSVGSFGRERRLVVEEPPPADLFGKDGHHGRLAAGD